MSRSLHIVCLDVPWPADYGGAIDMMNRISALHQLGIDIHLHYFSYNERGMPNELNRFCSRISIYERKKGHQGFSAKLPYIVASRINDELAARLNEDNAPVLLEGLHCTGVLSSLDLSARKVVVRMHNEESIYYRELARSARSVFKKLYFLHESRLIRRYNKHLPQPVTYACISANDCALLEQEYGLQHTLFLPAFPSWQQVNAEEGAGTLCLYHGNLSVPENEEAATWLLRHVFSVVRKPFVIAGKKPSRKLRKLAHLYQHTCMVADPTDAELNDLIRKAHINILPSFNKQPTGLRLKLLHSLFEGRHCLVNSPMVNGTGLETACHIADSARGFASVITQLYLQPFTGEEIRLRKKLLEETYSNEQNARALIQYLY